MQTLYMAALTLGVLFALVSLLAGDIIGDVLHSSLDFLSVDFLSPAVLAGGVTVFGGAGILLGRYSGLGSGAVGALSLLAALAVAAALYLGVVKPMERSEVSSGFSMTELPGRLGEITVPVPAGGFGEVMVRFGASNSLHTAASFDGKPLPAGLRVVVVEVREGVAYAAGLDEEELKRGDL
ncbi:protease [Paenibacillus spiritus]|uniref:Protease n=1 Tax=Paenibacillus spiritus TaxID=2496557 RepID=A0A5J5GBF7_9BACL|nr:protease [Paenibacillus spiritus]KAA9005358.1 protease [Paenibacillus spiritus]